MFQVYRFDSAAFEKGATGCPYLDLWVDSSRETASHLINLLGGRDHDRAEAAADVLADLIKKGEINFTDFDALGKVLAVGPRVSGKPLIEAWSSLIQVYRLCELDAQMEDKNAPSTPSKERLKLHRAELFERTGTSERPVLIPGVLNDVGIFALSGLHASGYPLLKPMSQLTRLTGITTQVNALAGHSPSWQDFQGCSFPRMLGHAHQGSSEFRDSLQLKKCVGVGISTGSLVLASLAIKNPDLFDVLILICPPFEIRGLKRKCQLLMASIGSKIPPTVPGMDAIEIRIPSPKSTASKLVRKNPSPKRSPLNPYGAFRDALLFTRKHFGDLKVPTLIISGTKDRIAPTSAINEIIQKNNRSNLHHHAVPNGKHLLPIMREGNIVVPIIRRFIEDNDILTKLDLERLAVGE
jgi:pimeloyl-ACP methyl ester carboxylesterase